MKDFVKLKEEIKKHVTLGEMLREDGRVTLEVDEEQIHCPFHGADNKKSARYYKQTDTMYCWACKKIWDVFSYTQQERGSTLREAINSLVKENHIDISSVPEQIDVLIQGITGQEKPAEINRNRIFLMQVRDCIFKLKDSIAVEKYQRLVHSYMLLKYLVSDEKYVEACNKMNEALTRITKEI
jgi:DNA primase